MRSGAAVGCPQPGEGWIRDEFDDGGLCPHSARMFNNHAPVVSFSHPLVARSGHLVRRPCCSWGPLAGGSGAVVVVLLDGRLAERREPGEGSPRARSERVPLLLRRRRSSDTSAKRLCAQGD